MWRRPATPSPRSVLSAAPLLLVLGCEPSPDPTAAEDAHWVTHGLQLGPAPEQLDILFVVDDSPSMAEEAESLAANWSAIAYALSWITEHGCWDNRSLNWRLAVVRTSVAGPGCPDGPDGGAFESRSCRARPGDFLRPASGPDGPFDGPADLFDAACGSVCDLEELPIRPSAARAGDVARVRPWLEGGTCSAGNLPPQIPLERALPCLAPVGVAGCAHESPLEAIRRALLRARDDGTPEAGFRRPGADLLVLFFTDEADCSFAPAGAPALDPEGDRTLWRDPQASAPSSAICRRAGIVCTEGDGDEPECRPVDLDPSGRPAATPQDAVLHPLARYVEVLQADLRLQRQTRSEAWTLLLTVDGRTDPVQDPPPTDPQFEATFGAPLGCTSGSGRGAASERLRALAKHPDFANASAERYTPTICNDDMSHVLDPLACTLLGRVRALCVPTTVPEYHPAATVDSLAVCRLEEVEDTPDGPTRAPVLPCVAMCGGTPCPPGRRGEADDWAFPAGTEVCAQWLTDTFQATPSLLDDLSFPCVDRGLNREVILRRASCRPRVGARWLEMTCHRPTPDLDP